MSSSTLRQNWRALLLASALALVPGIAAAQTGTVRGTVSGPAGQAVSAATVAVTGTRFTTVTNTLGQFTLAGVPQGVARLHVSRPGFVAKTSDVTVRPGEETLVAIQLQETNVELDAMVVSASRRAERRSEAPATVTRVNADQLAATPGNAFVGALKQATGLDFVQVGMTSVAINARGFNSSFNNRMLMLEDGRVAVLPENGLPVGGFTPIPKIDLAGIEVVVGPGSAMYGADASNGVLTLQSKDPREYPGLQFEVTGANRSYMDVQGRYAGSRGNWGYKLAGEWNSFNDWSNRIHATAAATSPWETSVGDTTGLNWDSNVGRAYGSVIRYFGDAQVSLTGGYSRSNGVGQTNVGRNQLVNWTYNVVQLKAQNAHWYLGAYRTESNAGDSYAANRYTTNRAVSPASISDDSVRRMSDWPSDGQLYAAEIQNNFRVRPLLNTLVTWGGQIRHDIVSSDRQWLTDRLTGEDLVIDQRGVYAQTETPLVPQLRLLLAARYDDHESYDPQFSPKAGLVWTPVNGQSLRFFYNRAFKSPSTLQTSFYIPNFVPFVGVFGNREGITVRKASDNSLVREYAPLQPEQNTTWEAGYKGLINGRLFIDVSGYYSRYRNFLSPLVTVANPLTGATATIAYNSATGEALTSETGGPQVVLTYFNLGRARLWGTDASVTYVLNPKVDFTGTFSYLNLDEITGINTNLASEREATALNSPSTKWTAGIHARDLGRWSGGTVLRYVNGYRFVSGINNGRIPTFSTLDANVGYRIPNLHSQVNLAVANLFSCHAYDATIADGEQCGVGVKHTEMVNMPSIGTMVYLGLRVDVQ
ncbi:MAG: TonB-dependent receptor domain-containing protein [Longimicrobiaceae bacterium]